MNILVACEFSGILTNALRRKGHNAWSCDLLPSEGTAYHLRGDVRRALHGHLASNFPQHMAAPLPLYLQWQAMIAFPPCTYLCSSGLHWNKKDPDRSAKTKEALMFVDFLLNAPLQFIALENPIGCISTKIRKPDQIIQPWQFGHNASKSTCLWLKGLPKLTPTQIIPPDRIINGKPRWANQTDSGQNRLSPSATRWADRSKSYEGVMQAMADQWFEKSWPPSSGAL